MMISIFRRMPNFRLIGKCHHQIMLQTPHQLSINILIKTSLLNRFYQARSRNELNDDAAKASGKNLAWSAYEKAVMSYVRADLTVPGMRRKFIEYGGKDLFPDRSYKAMLHYCSSDINNGQSLNNNYQLSHAEKEKIDTLLAKIKDIPCFRSKLYSEEQDEIIKHQVMATSSYNEATQRYNIQHVDWHHIAGLLNNSFTSKQCRARWMNVLDPNIIKDEFSAEEDALLLQLYDEFGKKWSKIAERMGGRRTGMQCLSRWLLINPVVKQGPWTAEEKQQLSLIITCLLEFRNTLPPLDELMERLYRAAAPEFRKKKELDEELRKKIVQGKTYVIAGELLKRSPTSCQNLWREELDPSKKRGSFSKEEVSLVLQGIYVYGEDYARIAAEYLPGRTGKNVSVRWRNMNGKVENLVLSQDRANKKQLRESQPGYNFLSYMQAKPDLSPAYFEQLAEDVLYYHRFRLL